MIKILYLIFFAICSLSVKCQVFDPWTNKIIHLENGKVGMREGVYKGLTTYYGAFAHIPKADNYTALPFLLISNDFKNKPVLLVFNGGPGVTNFIIPNGIDSLLLHFNVLLPGYRDIDIEKPEPQNHSILDPVELIVQDATEIVRQLEADTVFVVGHSFGSIYANEYIRKNGSDTAMAVLFSPIFVGNIYDVAANMEQMVFSYFRNNDYTDLYDTLLIKIQSKYPKEVSMGLVYYLSHYNNFNQLIAMIQTKVDIPPVLLNIYQQQTKEVNKEAQKENLSACLFIPEQQIIFNDTNRTYIRQAIIEYFLSLITNKKSTNYRNLQPVKIYIGEYDYQMNDGEIIPHTSHYDVWTVAYKYIIQTYLQCRINP